MFPNACSCYWRAYQNHFRGGLIGKECIKLPHILIQKACTKLSAFRYPAGWSFIDWAVGVPSGEYEGITTDRYNISDLLYGIDNDGHLDLMNIQKKQLTIFNENGRVTAGTSY
jgi:hypothetical protein